MNDYEKAKLLRVQENQERLKLLGVKNIVNSLPSLVQSKKTKKRKDKTTFNNENDVNYMSDHGGDGDENHSKENDTSVVEPTKVLSLKFCFVYIFFIYKFLSDGILICYSDTVLNILHQCP